MRLKLTCSANQETQLSRIILQHSGIAIQNHQRDNLRTTVRQLCHRFGYRSIDELIQVLLKAKNTDNELAFLITNITVDESYFFRIKEQFLWLEYHYLPELIQQRRDSGQRSLRIWSAGCSQGQEIYSIAMLLHRLLDDIDQWQLHLLATDINTKVLSQGIRGKYGQWSFRATPRHYQQRFFQQRDHHYLLDKNIRDRVKFSYLNLVDDSFPSILSETSALDLILCRNVFIYLNHEVVGNVLNKFSQCLVNDGVLLLGPSDLVNINVASLLTVNEHDILYYRKREISRGRHVKETSQPSKSVKRLADVAAVRHQIAADLLSPLPLLLKPAITAEVDHAASIARAARADKTLTAAKKNTETSADILHFSQLGQWLTVIEIIDKAIAAQGENVCLLCHKATALANLARLKEAEQLCQYSTARYACDTQTYVIHSLILGELKQLAPAEKALRRALYLDRNNPEIHYQLGLLLMQQGKKRAARKHLSNALALAKQYAPNQEISHAQGMTYQQFSQVLQQKLADYPLAKQANI